MTPGLPASETVMTSKQCRLTQASVHRAASGKGKMRKSIEAKNQGSTSARGRGEDVLPPWPTAGRSESILARRVRFPK